MKSNHIRIAVILGSVSIIGIIFFQLYWVNKSYSLEEEQFNRTVEIALYNVAEKMASFNGLELPNENPVRQISSNYFIVDINNVIDSKILDHFLKMEFEYSNIRIDYEYAIYDCETNQMVFGNYIRQDDKEKQKEKQFQKYDEFTYYFGILFPSKTGYILNSMNTWLISSFVLFTAIFFFAYAVFIILKQKRYSEVQKDFINNMTHEFKTPISTIGISANVLSNPEITNDPERLRNYTQIIAEQNKRLENQIEKVLQLATLEKHKLKLKMERLDLHEIIKSVTKGFRLNIEKNKGVISCDMGAKEAFVVADKQHLVNMVYNLLDNAIKYSNGPPEIHIETRNKNGMLYFTIRDKGIGIDKKHIKKVFDKFFRVPTGNVHNVKGFGLGLNYVKSIVNEHKWKIHIESEVGKGSRFIIVMKSIK
ncbi:MAG: HAMP domain-containing histidine kinase [Chlorobi bacterium]|nr:HAMP domain-containing histidine kinase [Chlorobiota bacterium]